MDNPIPLASNYFVAPQIAVADLLQLKALGFESIINNRPDHEVDDQPLSIELEKAAAELGLEYVHNPVDLKTLSESEVDAQVAALAGEKKTLAFCRTGTRSSVLWVLLNSAQGVNYNDLKTLVAGKGFDLSRCEPAMQPLIK
ncbi:TIGR01244 family sulfur transferase [Marinomonas sp.]|uniref:TIGR01244 family sulfur transferase n=1 Tax=Marinomonas sp. TaxID=1904862 RepID=UPI003F99B1E7